MGKKRPFGDPLFGPFNGSLDDLLVNYRIVKVVITRYKVKGENRQRASRTIKKQGFATEALAKAHADSMKWNTPEYLIEPYTP